MTSTSRSAPNAHAFTTSRRSLLGAMPAAAVAIAAPLPAIALEAPTDRTAWDAAMRTYERAKAEDTAFTPKAMALWRRFDEAVAKIEHVTVGPDPYFGRPKPVSTAHRAYVDLARKRVRQLAEGNRLDPLPHVQEHYKFCQELVAAADKRDTQIAALRAEMGVDAIDEQSEVLADALSDAESTLMHIPAPDAAALQWKLDRLIELEGPEEYLPGWSKDYARQTVADYRRMLGEAV